MIEELRELLQAIVIPQLEAIRGDIRRLEAKVDAIAMKLEGYRRELVPKIGGLESEIRRVEDTLSSDFVRMESIVDVRLNAMNEKIDTFRRELLAEIKAATAR